MRSLKNYGKEGGRDDTRSVSTLSDKYSGLNGDELMSALMTQVAAAKKDGTFSAEQIDSFASFVMPNLDPASRARLGALIEMIKNG